MKKIRLIFVFFVLIGLTGCLPHRRAKQISLFGEEDINGNESYSKKDNLSWIGRYKLEDSERDVYIELSLEAGSSNISLDIICSKYMTNSEDGEINNFSFTTYLDSIDKDVININDSYLGITGSIKKSDSDFIITIDSSENDNYKNINGTYKREKNGTDIKGYFKGENGEIAITPLGSKYAKVSSNISKDETTYILSLVYSIDDDTLVYDNIESALIEETSDGIKIKSDIPYLEGEYTKEG